LSAVLRAGCEVWRIGEVVGEKDVRFA